LIQLPRRFLPSNRYLRTFCACCDTYPSGDLKLSRKIRIESWQMIIIPDGTIILYSKHGYCSINSSWLIAFIVNAIFVNRHNLISSMG
jgi:hypothetical protein